MPKIVAEQRKAWSRLWRHKDIPGYRHLSWPGRKAVDCQIIGDAFGVANFWRGVLAVVAGVLAANIVCWNLDLVAWQRDLLRCLPVLLAAPGMATLRRRLIVKRLRNGGSGTRRPKA